MRTHFSRLYGQVHCRLFFCDKVTEISAVIGYTVITTETKSCTKAKIWQNALQEHIYTLPFGENGVYFI